MPDPTPQMLKLTPQTGGSEDGVFRVSLGVFAKHWTPGRAKTRLAATLGSDRAAACAKRFVETLIDRLAAVEAERTIAFTPADQTKAFEELVASRPWKASLQPEGSLGDRMRWFFEQACAANHEAALIVGADSPDLPIEVIERAFQQLTSHEGTLRAIISPTDDGGYWMVGARKGAPPIFGDLPWSTPQLWEATLNRLAAEGWQAGRDYAVGHQWYDVDTEDDLLGLIERLKTADPADEPLKRLAIDLDDIISL